MSPTATSGKRLRSSDTIWAAVRLPPPRSKKSSSRLRTVAPRTSSHSSATHAATPCSSAASPGAPAPGSGQGSASRSTFPDVRVGIESTGASRGTIAAGMLLRSAGHGGGGVEPVVDGDVADQELVARGGTAHRGRRSDHAVEPEQGAVDLAELDPPAADLDLVVGPAGEQQPVRVVHHDVAAAVGPVPPEARHRGVLLGVLRGVEVAGQADPADDQLALLARPDRVQVAVHDGQVPAVEGQPDPDRAVRGELRAAGDHGRLGRPVGVPHLPARPHDPADQLGRHGLAAQDQQAHPVHRVLGPQGDQRRHRRDDRDLVGGQPRTHVQAAADQSAGRRDQARAVPPGEPHLLAGRVERDRQAGHHAVAGRERLVLEEQPCLGVHERRGVAMRDGHALGRAGRAGREDHPRVVVRGRVLADPGRRLPPALDGEVGPDDGDHGRLAEHQPRPLVGVVGVDGHVGAAGQQHGHDRDVEIGRARRQPDADLVARAHPERGELVGDGLGGLGELLVGQGVGAVVERGRLGGLRDRRPEDVDQRARGGSVGGTTEGHRASASARDDMCCIPEVSRVQVNGR